MTNPFFHEVQTLRQNSWIWFMVIILFMGGITPLLMGAYDQLVNARPWGNEPLPDTGLFLMIALILTCLLVASGVIYFLRMETQIDGSGIQYRLFPTQAKWRKIFPEEISGYQVRELGFFRSIILKKGIKSFGKNEKMINLTATNQLILTLKNGKTVIIGTDNPQGMEWAMRRLLQKNVTV